MFSFKFTLLLTLLSVYGNQVCPSKVPPSYVQVRTTNVKNSMKTLIVGGTDAAAGEFPYLVSIIIHYEGDEFWTPYCGGIIISPSKILTAAHCKTVITKKYHAIRAVGGVTDLTAETPSRQEAEVDLAKFYTHPQHDDFTFLNDIAIIKLQTPFTLTSQVKSIPLPASSFIASGTGMIAGWGQISEGGESSHTLKKATIDIFSDEFCKNTYGDDFKAGMMCAGKVDGSKDACIGDSGGPLVTIDPGTKLHLLVGIISFGIGCGKEGQLGFYTKVSHYRDWMSTIS